MFIRCYELTKVFTVSSHTSKEFIPLNITILTVSDTRTEADDTSGDLLKSMAEEVGHHVLEKVIVIGGLEEEEEKRILDR